MKVKGKAHDPWFKIIRKRSKKMRENGEKDAEKGKNWRNLIEKREFSYKIKFKLSISLYTFSANLRKSY